MTLYKCTLLFILFPTTVKALSPRVTIIILILIIILIIIIIIIIIIIHKTIFIVLSSMARSYMREFTLGPLSESWSSPGGRQLVGQAANLTFESAAEHSPVAFCTITQHRL